MYIIGKEILCFYFIYWIIFIKVLGIRIFIKIYVYGLLRDKDGRKMFKLLNNVIEFEYLFSKYDDEMIKYYFFLVIFFGEDGNFSEDKFIDIVNFELVNNYGNLVFRIVKMISNFFLEGLIYR